MADEIIEIIRRHLEEYEEKIVRAKAELEIRHRQDAFARRDFEYNQARKDALDRLLEEIER